MIRTVLTFLFWAVMLPLGALVGFPVVLLTGNVEFLYGIGTRVASAGIRLLGIRIEVSGLCKLDPRGTYVFMSNHASNLDPPALIPLLPRRTSVLVKKELFRIPIFGYAMRLASLVPVDRSNREAAVASIRAAGEVMRKGLNMTVFVEGTRSRDGRLLPFKKGPFYLAAESGMPIVPVTIVNSHALWPKGRWYARSGSVKIVFHDPLDPRAYLGNEQLMLAVRRSIASALPPETRD